MAITASSNPIRHLFSLFADLGDRFQRRRIWSPFAVVVGLLLLKQGGRRRTYAKMLHIMEHSYSALLGWKRRPSLASFTQARKKLTAHACHDLLREINARVDATAGGRFNHPSGRRLVAIDSTRVVMPLTTSTVQRYPRPGYREGLKAHYPQALTVFAVDVMKRLPLDWVMLAKGHGEREGALALAQGLREGDIVIADRGFPGREFVGDLVAKKLDVVMRMTTAEACAWDEVKSFVEGDHDEQEVEVWVDRHRSVRVRLIRRKFRVGRPKKHQKAETMVIMTTLLDATTFPNDEILRIYTARWGVETVLRELKVDLDVERFHSRSRIGFEQEIAMALIWIALTSSLQHLAEQTLTDGRRVARTHCAYIAELMIEAACSGIDPWQDWENHLAWIRSGATKPRPGRSFPRYSKSPFGRFNNSMAK